MSESPFDIYAQWFESLAPELANELASALMQLFPGELITPTLATPHMTDGLIPRMRRLCRTPAKEVGMVSTLVTLTDLAMLERGETEHADRTSQLLDMLQATDAGGMGDGSSMDDAVAQWLSNQQLRQPLRKRRWGKERDRWLELAAGPLAQDQLTDYLRKKMMGVE